MKSITRSNVKIRVNPEWAIPQDVIEQAVAQHLADGRSTTVSVRKAQHHPATLYRPLQATEVCEGAVVWARAYDKGGCLVAQTPCLKVVNAELVRSPEYEVADETDWIPVLRHGRIDWKVPGDAARCEFHVLRESSPEEMTTWFAPTVDWKYDIGKDLRIREEGTIQGRQQHTPIVEVCDAFMITSHGDGSTKGFLIEA